MALWKRSKQRVQLSQNEVLTVARVAKFISATPAIPRQIWAWRVTSCLAVCTKEKSSEGFFDRRDMVGLPLSFEKSPWRFLHHFLLFLSFMVNTRICKVH